MESERLIVRMDSAPGDGGAVLGRHFLSVLTNVLALLKQADIEMSGELKSEFFIVDASHSSPYEVKIACRPLADERLFAKDGGAVLALSNVFRAIQDGKADDLSAPMMLRVENFIAPCRAKARHRLSYLELGFVNGREIAPPVSIDQPIVERVDESRAQEFVCRTIVSGPAKMLDLRKEGKQKKGKIQMKILPLSGGEVTCILDQKLRERAKAAMDNVAIMRGMGRYRPNGVHPYQIEVVGDDDIDIVYPDPDAPKLSELAGAFPGLTDGKSVTEYLREIRGEE